MIDVAYNRAYIALGANLDERVHNISKALALLNRHPQVKVVRVSSLIETEAEEGPAHQPNFINGVAQLQTTLTPEELLEFMLQTENRLGRKRREKRGPRTIDLDLLLYADQIIDQPHLKLPHPRMHRRRFVMIPLAEIAPEIVHPVLKQTARQLLEELQKDDKL